MDQPLMLQPYEHALVQAEQRVKPAAFPQALFRVRFMQGAVFLNFNPIALFILFFVVIIPLLINPANISAETT
ncbi:MAG: hypothetical protein GX847_06055 [Clostridiales bacterium]|nr:hypothetical protein [Clostridiales bacterium]